MARQFGILTTISGLSSTMVINNVDESESVEIAEGRDENGYVTDRKAYSKTTTVTGDGLLDTNSIPPSAVSAGATITINSKTFLIESCSVKQANNDFAKVSFTATCKDAATASAYTAPSTT